MNCNICVKKFNIYEVIYEKTSSYMKYSTLRFSTSFFLRRNIVLYVEHSTKTSLRSFALRVAALRCHIDTLRASLYVV